MWVSSALSVNLRVLVFCTRDMRSDNIMCTKYEQTRDQCSVNLHFLGRLSWNASIERGNWQNYCRLKENKLRSLLREVVIADNRQ